MKFYKPEELKVGMRLAKPIYSKQGVLLYDRDARLTDTSIASINKFGLLGVMILDPAEPLPPMTPEEIEAERLQTSYMFRLRDSLVAISKGRKPEDLENLVGDICEHFAHMNAPIVFSQTIRSGEDYNYKHSVCTAILSAMIAKHMKLSPSSIEAVVLSALLCDFGYLYVPKSIMMKQPDQLTSLELLSIDQYRTKAQALLKPGTNPYSLPQETLYTLQEFLKISRKENLELDAAALSIHTRILIVADRYDRMTAMSLNYKPVSGFAAIRDMESKKSLYDPAVVKALSNCLSILPVGQCVELSTQSKGMVLEQNEGDAFHPRVLDLRTNKIYDLSSKKLKGVIEVKDVLISMDQRYIFDEQTLKQFVPDEPLKTMTRRFRNRLNAAKRRDAAKWHRP